MHRNKTKKYNPGESFLRLGQWVPKEHFRTFLFNSKNEKKLANSYEEYEDMITSGLWFDVEQEQKPTRKSKDAVCPTS